MTISLVKLTSGALSGSFQVFQSFSSPLALVMHSGALLASFSSSTEPVHSLPGFTAFFWASVSEVNRTTAAIATRPTNQLGRNITKNSFAKSCVRDPMSSLFHFPYSQRHLVRLPLGEDLAHTFAVGTLADVRPLPLLQDEEGDVVAELRLHVVLGADDEILLRLLAQGMGEILELDLFHQVGSRVRDAGVVLVQANLQHPPLKGSNLLGDEDHSLDTGRFLLLLCGGRLFDGILPQRVVMLGGVVEGLGDAFLSQAELEFNAVAALRPLRSLEFEGVDYA